MNDPDTRDPRLDRLYRDVAREEPPAHLDAAILAAARREVGARPRSLSTALRRWHVPVSIAAVVVVSVTLVILVREEGGGRIGETRVPSATAPADRSDAAPAPSPPAVSAKRDAQPQAEVSAPAGLRDSREESRRLGTLSNLEDTARRESDSVAASRAAAAAPKAAAEPVPDPFRASPLEPAQERAPASASRDTVAAGELRAASPGPVDQEADAPATTEQRPATPASDVPAGRPMARALAVKPAGQERPPVWQGFEKEPPEKWLARIEALRREGRAAEAEEMRAEFKRRFPEHPLAQDAK